MNPENLDRDCLVSLGSNLGDSVANVQNAFEALQEFSNSTIQKSSLWISSPVDCPPDSPDFINAVAAFDPLENETPESLLSKLQKLEIKFGRQPKSVMNEPRPLDLDLIAFKSETRDTELLTLPHPRFHLRKFVLAPLDELFPALVLPNQSQSVSELLQSLDSEETISKYLP